MTDAENMLSNQKYEAPALQSKNNTTTIKSESPKKTDTERSGNSRLSKLKAQVKALSNNALFGLCVGIVATVVMTFVGVDLSSRVGHPFYYSGSQFLLGDYEGLEFVWQDHKVDNLGAVQIALWNGGNHFIDGEQFANDVPIVIKELNNIENIKILAASLKYISRESLDFKLNIQNDGKSDYVELTFNQQEALESSDGAVVKILYTTDSSEDLCFCKWKIISRVKGFPDGFEAQDFFDVPVSLRKVF